MRTKLLLYLVPLAAACGGGGGSTQDAGVDAYVFPDAPDSVPTLTSFVPTPANVTAGVPTAITWTWTYLTPPSPAPTCTIDNGVGTVTNGQMTMVTLDASTTFRLTCSNSIGMTARDTLISIPPAAPAIATFTATPSPLMPNAATTVTFNWTYSNAPSPTPVCTIDGGIGTATTGMTASVTLAQARTYRLRCQNSQGTATRDTTVSVDECAGGTHDCNANATCTDTTEGFACTCKSGYSGNGDVCSAQVACGTTPSLCDANATCVGGSQCVCNVGFVGDGTTCTRERLTFVTATTGTGNLSTWAGAGTNAGVAAADAICNLEASQAGLPGTYIAWLSDSTSDAYCRVHGRTGKKATNCGLGALPVAAGPWVRADAARTPAAPAIDKLLAPARQTFFPVTYRADGVDVATTLPTLIFTGTDDSGVLTGTACTDWTSTGGTGAMGDLAGGGTAWTDYGTDPSCSTFGRLRCVETGSGPALPSRHPVAPRRAFVTSVSGTGVLSTWPDAGGVTGISAADAICQARARYAGYTNAASFKAWAAYSSIYAVNRLSGNGPWYRPDGILVASNKSDLIDGRLGAPLYQMETNAYAAGNAETGSVWTGAMYSGYYYSTTYSCLSWSSTSYTSIVGRTDIADYRWTAIGSSSSFPTTQSCSAPDYRLYCLDDTP